MSLRVQVAYAAPGAEALVSLDLPSGATVADAVARSGLLARLALDAARLGYAIFGQAARADTPLADGDRVELTRPLQADAKTLRRMRAAERPLPPTRPGKRKRAR
jgi:putative ubiquitin-RnfH superfamily antitoxin RatB of RatAB toxin-antitoxin module